MAVKLTKAGKLVIFILVAIIAITGAWFAKDLPIFKKVTKGKVKAETAGVPVTTEAKAGTIRLSLDSWIGWKILIDGKAKGIFDDLGVNVEFSIIDDATQSSNALIANNLDAAGYTVNRYAFLYQKFIKAGVPVKMPYIVNSSSGGDGIIAAKSINRIEDLVGKKIAVPRFSEAQTLIEWMLANSSLTDKDVTAIRKSMVLVETPDDAAKAFFAGQVDAAATWQPYLTQAQQSTDSHVLFSTKSATNLILDGIVFRKDFLDQNKELVSKFIEGALKAQDLYDKEFEPIKNTMPLFSTMSDNDIKGMLGDATISDYKTNVELMKGTAQKLFKDMSSIWQVLGESADPGEALSAFDSSLIEPLESKFKVAKTVTKKFTEADRKEAKEQSNDQALLTQNLTISFETGSATIKADSYEALNNFAETAMLLNNVVIQIEGNTDNVGSEMANVSLSEKRANAVLTYLKFQGLDITRMVALGNGPKNPIASNDSLTGKAKNRRTDMFFKVVD